MIVGVVALGMVRPFLGNDTASCHSSPGEECDTSSAVQSQPKLRAEELNPIAAGGISGVAVVDEIGGPFSVPAGAARFIFGLKRGPAVTHWPSRCLEQLAKAVDLNQAAPAYTDGIQLSLADEFVELCVPQTGHLFRLSHCGRDRLHAAS